MIPFKILFVDDEEINLLNFRMIFQERYEIITALSGEEGLRCFENTKDIGLVISDQRMPGISGTEMLSKIYDIDPDPIRVLLTAHSQVEYVLDAINLGRIYQYILKPWDENTLSQVIDRAQDLYQLKKENISLTDKLAEKNRKLKLANKKLLNVNIELERDVQRREKLEVSLRESEERFRKFANATQDIIVLFDISGRGLYANPAAERLLGYSDDEFLQKPLVFALCRKDRHIVKEEISMLLTTNQAPHPREVRVQKKNLEYLDMEMNLFCIDLSGGERIIGSMIRDISQRKIAEEKLRLSEKRLGDLSAMLITAQDDERRRLAMELHDEFGQSLAALKLQIRGMENSLHNNNEFHKDKIIEALRELRQYVNMQIEDVRSLSRELWPMMVDHLGVDAAFENLIGGFLGHAEVEIDVNMEHLGRFFPVEEQRHLYRLLQESLNNVIKHANATDIQVRASIVGDEIVLAVHDNGCGFDVEAVSTSTGKTRGIGLQAIAERMKILCGKMEINSRPGMGTSIIFTLAKNRNC
ncbi:PAS domain S-box [Desulfocapsa sulfexigens DSM 10523]|uniref:histidine kinase n=1 Tax=Desulfocapsa sulfexigens (strain DSM 10523 / SB164P1) TaxID=1167006 RepID=M1PSR0_DESSD|nr:PAS domain S-box protein [Desulfocapsa sulfexigens]AGF79361.1 PAS domain S-box [Desulfocapsa sulfexigens DSM 10523]